MYKTGRRVGRILFNHKMHYDMDQLIKALVVQTMDETKLAEYQQTNQSDVGLYKLAENLYLSLRGTQPDSKQAKKAISNFVGELDIYSHYPLSHKLLCVIEDIIWNKYKDDPKPIIKIVVSVMNSEAAFDWYQNKRRYR